MQTQCAVFSSFFRLSMQGLYSVTVISGLALMTFSLSRLWDKMQNTTTPPCPQKTWSFTCLACALQIRSAGQGWQKQSHTMLKTGRIWKTPSASFCRFLTAKYATVHVGHGWCTASHTNIQHGPKHHVKLVSFDRCTSKQRTFTHRLSHKNTNYGFRVVSSPMRETVCRAKPILGPQF